MTEVTEDTNSGLNPVAIIESVAPEGWKKKIGKVAAQLGIGTRKGAQLYAAGRDQIDTSEGKSIVSKAMAEAVAREAVDNPIMMERARARFLNEFGAKQENLEAVMIAAAEHLNSGPPPAPLLLTNDDKFAPNDGVDEALAEDDAAPLEGDWAAAFTREAEGATSDELRDRLARVLAGEIRSPGTYSRGVLRMIAELDRADIEAVKECMPFRVGDAIYNLTSVEGLRISRLLKLADAGLVADAASGLSRIFEFTAEQDLFVSSCFGKVFGIVVRKDNGVQLQRAFAPLNRAGQSVADLLDEDGDLERQALIDLGNTFENEAVEISLVKINSRVDNFVKFTTIRYLKTRNVNVFKSPSGSPLTNYNLFPRGDPFLPRSS